jgi:hypothetical protein
MAKKGETRPPATSPEVQEARMVNMAYKLAERQMMEGTASSQVITHFLKLGSSREKREMEKLEEENKLLRAKTESLESAKHVEELYAEAIKSMKKYSGHEDE